MATSKVSSEERLLRKRQAARVRQQRCRARKRQALLERQVKDKSEHAAQPGHVAVTPNENHHPNMSPSHRSPPLNYGRTESPRSVFWKEATAWAHAEASHGYAERQQAWSSPRLDARFDYSTPVEGHPIYSRRYVQNPPHAPPRSMPRSMPRLVPAMRPHPPPPRFYLERRPQFVIERDQPEFYRHPEAKYHQSAKPWPVKLKAPVPPLKLFPKVAPPPKRTNPIKSEEEAAIDAILSLKAEVVSPATTRLPGEEDQSASRDIRPGLYKMMRN